MSKYAAELGEPEDGSDVTRLREMEVRRMILLGKVDVAKAFLKRLERNGVALDQRGIGIDRSQRQNNPLDTGRWGT